MEENIQKVNIATQPAVTMPRVVGGTASQPTAASVPQRPSRPGFDRRGGGRGGAPRGRNPHFMERPKEEFMEKTLDVRRVTRVVAGGKRFRFRVTLVLGDMKGRVGVGVAKGLDVATSIAKAKVAAKKNIFTVPLKGATIPHEVEAKFSAARIRLKPAVEGHGLRAGGAARVVLSLAGVKDIVAKALGRTPNKLTNALAVIEALKKLRLSRNK